MKINFWNALVHFSASKKDLGKWMWIGVYPKLRFLNIVGP